MTTPFFKLIVKMMLVFELRKESGVHWNVRCIICRTVASHYITICCGPTGVLTALPT